VAAFVELLDLSEAPTTPEVDNILSLATGIFGAHTAVLALFNDKRVRRAGDGRLGTAVAARAAPALPCARAGGCGAGSCCLPECVCVPLGPHTALLFQAC
jgi:hypothetical protein